MKPLFPLGLSLTLLLSEPTRAADLIGAHKVIEKVSASERGDQNEKPDSAEALLADLASYKSEVSSLTPEAAANRWLALLDRSLKIATSNGDGSGVDFSALVAVLPPTASWPFLEKALASRKADKPVDRLSLNALRWFIHTLTGDVAAQKKDYRAIMDDISALPANVAPYAASISEALTKQVIDASDDPAFIFQVLKEQLHRQIALLTKQKSQGGYYNSFSFPELVKVVGEKQAETLIKQALTTYAGPISFRGKRTVALARQIAAENMASLAAPQWELTNEYGSDALYEAMVKRFNPTTTDYHFIQAQSYQLARLILAGKLEDASKLQASFPADRSPRLPSYMIEEAEKTGSLDKVAEYLGAALKKNPSLPYWENFFEASNKDKQPERAIKMMREALAQKEIDPSTAQNLRQNLASSLIAAGMVEDGVAELLLIAKDAQGNVSEHSNPTQEIALNIIALGRLLNRPEWVEKGLALAAQELEAQKQSKYSSPLSFANSLAQELIDLKRVPQAEKLLIEYLGFAQQKAASSEQEYAPMSEINSSLAILAGIYSEAGMNSDVVTLLDSAPFWYATDLSQVMAIDVHDSTRRGFYLGDCAARALELTGDKSTPIQITEAMLAEHPGDDRAYEALLRVAGSAALPTLDRMAAEDQFQERPLIWKAQLLLNEGKLAEAEKAVRAAIAIDPSDGEQGTGDRMRAYSVLAGIKEAQGDAKEAEFFRGVVKAIRLSEEADALYTAGLQNQAISLYEKSLTMFADAYCIQSRLAIRLNELGQWKEAEEHYRKAYELMPDSFGRVESHCFGCERAFAGEKQQSVAERVFTSLAQNNPDNPKVHYLLGYLRMEQDRNEEAMAEFQKATALDPDYLNAWKKMAEMKSELLLTTSERNTIARNIVRLDPLSRHSSLPLSGVTEIGDIWTALNAAQGNETPSGLYPLKAAQKFIESLPEGPAKARILQEIQNEDIAMSPGIASFARESFVSQTQQILTAARELNAR